MKISQLRATFDQEKYSRLRRCPDNCPRGKLLPRQLPPAWLPPQIIAPRTTDLEDNCPRGKLHPRTTAPWMIAPQIIGPRTIAPDDNCPRKKNPPPLNNCPPENCTCEIAPWTIAAGENPPTSSCALLLVEAIPSSRSHCLYWFVVFKDHLIAISGYVYTPCAN